MAKSGGESLEKLEDMIVRAAETTAAHARAAKAAVGTVIFGQEQVVEHALITILSGGHALLVGVPGLAKTKLVETMGIVLGLDARRIQFTPDLMPSDILGSEVLEESPGVAMGRTVDGHRRRRSCRLVGHQLRTAWVWVTRPSRRPSSSRSSVSTTIVVRPRCRGRPTAVA